MNFIKNRYFSGFFFFLFFCCLLPLPAEVGFSLPQIGSLDNRDVVFRQFLQDAEASRRRIFAYGVTPEELAEYITIYSYIPTVSDGILALAARCNIPYGNLASINSLSHPESLVSGIPMLLPSMRGLFVAENPQTDLEMLMASSRREGRVSIVINGRNYRFFPGEDLNPTERIFFLNRGFRFPLPEIRLTSPYGYRTNPVTGRHAMHNGVDLAAPLGTPVFAARSGKISSVGEDPVYGLFVLISHEDNWLSLYGHLSRIEVSLNQEVRSGNLIGRVGSTGQSTGPHLHFELRQNGRAQDPSRLLRLFSN